MRDRLPKRTPESEFLSEEEARFHGRINRITLHAGHLDAVAEAIGKACQGFRGKGRMLELGCGSAQMSVAMALRFPSLRCVAADGDPVMVEQARELVRGMGLDSRIEVRKAHVPHDDLGTGYDLVMSRSTLHHFQDPLDFWRVVRRAAGEEGSIHVFDLCRPLRISDALAIVEVRSRSFPEFHKKSYLRSFLAAYRPAEVARQLATVGLKGCTIRGLVPSHMAVTR